MFSMGRFSFLQADSLELKKAIFRLRYEVYVEEFGFEKPEDHPDGYETDLYDPHSIHFAALNEEKEVVGTVRMILNSERGFPIEHAATLNFIGEKPAADKITEISRLAVKKKYRRRLEDGMYGVESYPIKSEKGVLPKDSRAPGGREKRKRPVIVLGLYRMVYEATKAMGATHWYLIIEKALFYALKRFGWLFYQIGDPVNYHGERIPYLGILKDIDPYLMRTNPELYEFYTSGMKDKSRLN